MKQLRGSLKHRAGLWTHFILLGLIVTQNVNAIEDLPGEIFVVLKPDAASRVTMTKDSDGIAATGLPALDRVNQRYKVRQAIDIKAHVGAPQFLSQKNRRTVVIPVQSHDEKVRSLIERLSNLEEIENVHYVSYLSTALTPTDPNWSSQWNYNANHLQAEQAWDVHSGTDNVVVAIIDTGLDHQHPDLAANIWGGVIPIGIDICGDSNDNGCAFERDTDPQHNAGGTTSHGTKVAGVIGASINNGLFIAGIAGGIHPNPGAQLWALRAGVDMNQSAGISPLAVIVALNEVINHVETTGLPHVVNMSFGGTRVDFQGQIDSAWETGRVVFVGAANGQSNATPVYPAASMHVIGVTGLDRDDQKSAQSGYGSYVDVAAPVDEVPTLAYNTVDSSHIYWTTTGSTPSVAAAQVSGLAALVWSKYPTLTNAGVVRQIVETTDDISTANMGEDWSGMIGTGRVNAYRALTEWSGPLQVQADQTLTWGGTIKVTGDLTIPAGITLTLDPGTTVQFDANSDDTETDDDNDDNRSELIVAGTLNASAGGITFRSSNDAASASRSDWYGIHIETGGTANLSGATIRDASRCVQSHDLTGVTVSAATTFEHCARTVGLSPTQPQVDHLLTATLTGLDETVTGEHWQWQRRRNDEVPWVNITLSSSSRTARQTTEPEAYPALTTYTPVAADFLHELRVTLRYVDGGLYNYAQSEPTSPVVDVPPQPTAGLEASGGPAGIGVEWSAVTATPEVTKYRLAFQRLRVGAASWPQEYTSLATIPNRRTSYTQNSDANGDPVYPGYRYRYRLRAHNDVGPGAWSAAFPEAGVIRAANRPDPDGLVLDDESAGLVAAWACPNHNFCGPSPPSEDWTVAPLRLTAEIKSGTGSWTAASATVSGVQTTHAVSGLERGTVHEFRTLAVNVDDQEGSASEAVALVPLRKTAGDGRVELAWDSPGYSGLAWQYRSRSGTGSWGDWQPVSNAGATAQAVTGLTNGVSYRFQVRAVKGTTARAVSFIEAATPQGARTVSFGLETYTATEGGAAATVTVRLSPAATEALSIPIRFDPSSGDDYSHDLGTGKTVTFAQNGSSQTFTVTADQDTDSDDESVSLSFGTLPRGWLRALRRRRRGPWRT